MEGRLSEAAAKGSVSSLRELLEEDPLLLHRTIVSCIPQSPLHIALKLGHLDFAIQLLNQNQELATDLDSQGSSPLHLAAAKGYVNLVKLLLSIDPDVCLVRNQDGRTPLHLAAMKGQVEVLNKLAWVKPEAMLVLTDRGETALHLCVKHNRFQALKLLLDCIQRDGFVNLKDYDGNTILHLAVENKQIETVKILLGNTGVDVNAINANGFTALDILSQNTRDLNDVEIKDSLQRFGALRAKDIPSVARGQFPMKIPHATPPPLTSLRKNQVKKQKHISWLGRKKDVLMVVASLISTVAFQSGLAPPGGVWQDELTDDPDGKNHHVGMSIMAYQHPTAYGLFMVFNTLGFLASLSIILLLVSGLPLNRRRWLWLLMVIMWIAITSIVATYFITLDNMTPKHVEGVLYRVTKFSCLVWLGLMGLLVIANTARMIFWSLKKFGIVKGREREHRITIDNDSCEVF